MNHIPSQPARIIVGLSGGVDSAVSAFLLKQAGHDVLGIFMKNWEGDDTETYCPASEDLAEAQAVSDHLGIPFQSVNFADQYWQRVFAYFLDEHRAGRTPNPDILCNKEVKFKAFLDYAKQQGADYIATGHYVRRSSNDTNTQLLKGLDPQKDQSYFLYALNQTQLAQSIFPIGGLEKTEVRRIAKQIGLKNHARKDSTGICFIGERKFKAFLNEYLPAKPGLIQTPDGDILGQHDGLMFYTMGQRQGLQIGGQRGKSEAPWYVADKDLAANRLIVVQGNDHPALFRGTLTASQIHWINEPPKLPATLKAKTRYRQTDQTCTIHPDHDGRLQVIFEAPQRAITPGQSIVFYQEDICLGGGIIE
jgi:tRNA-specific 2-thiouridylase